MKNFKISIPKPCHEDWNNMTTNEKGRFCGSCAKTVVDFTQKSAKEVQDFFIKNKGKRVCGHFRRKQLDSIVLQIPEATFTQKLSFQKLFILTLLLVMGTTLFSCKNEAGKPQRIDKVELIDTIRTTDKVLERLKIDSVAKPIITIPTKINTTYQTTTTGLPIATSCKKDGITALPEIMGDVVEEGEVYIEEIAPVYFNIVSIPPRFKGTKASTKEVLQTVFEKRMRVFIAKNFDISTTVNLGLRKGKQRMYAQFTIDPLGNVTDIKIRAPHQKLKEYTIALIKKLPQFIPGKQNGINVSVRYTLPISFMVE